MRDADDIGARARFTVFITKEEEITKARDTEEASASARFTGFNTKHSTQDNGKGRQSEKRDKK